MEGWLLKQGNSIKRDWKKRYVRLGKDCIFRYYDKVNASEPLGEIPMLTCSVKPNTSIGKAHAFDVITPNRTFYFAAKDDNDFKQWSLAITKEIKRAIEGTMPNKLSVSAPNGLTTSSSLSGGRFTQSSGTGSPTLAPKSAWVYTQASTPTTGYLYRMKNGAFVKYYVDIKGDNMYFFAAEKTQDRRQSSCPVMLTACSVRCSTRQGNESLFQVVTPTQTLELKAESPSDAINWITVFNNAASLYKRRKMSAANGLATPTASQPKVSILDLAGLPTNKICADCSEKDPQWASINLGLFMCIECSGVHRSLGTHISKVRSVDLDQWDQNLIDFMRSMGNQKSNAIWEFNPLALKSKPSPTSSRADKTNYITQKYKVRQWADLTKVPKEDPAMNRNPSFAVAAAASQPVQTAPRQAKQVSHEGTLTKQGNTTKLWKPRWFVLQDNMLTYYHAKGDPAVIDSLNLATAHIRASPDITNMFEVILPHRTYFLQAESSDEFFKWIDVLKQSQAQKPKN